MTEEVENEALFSEENTKKVDIESSDSEENTDEVDNKSESEYDTAYFTVTPSTASGPPSPEEKALDSEENTVKVDNGAESNLFSLIYDLIISGADEIFSAIACALSFALMLIYKKGMMPTLEGGVRSLAAGVKGIGEKASEIKSTTDSFATDIRDRLTATERTLEALADGLGKLTATLDEREKNSYSADDLTTVMLAEIDMLYEIFNSAELPQYIKDRVGERIAEMKKTLEKRDKDDAES